MRRAGAAASVLLGVLLVTGCAPEPAVPGPLGLLVGGPSPLTTLEHRSAMNALVEDTERLVWGWWDLKDGGAMPCILPSGEEGASYGFRRQGPALSREEIPAAASRVFDYWSAEGVRVTMLPTTFYSDIMSIRVRSPGDDLWSDGSFLEFRVSERSSGISGATPCAVGDYREIKDLRPKTKHHELMKVYE